MWKLELFGFERDAATSMDPHLATATSCYPKQWIKGNVVNFISETKSMSKQDVHIVVTCPSKVVQWTEIMLYKLAAFPYIHGVE